MIALASWTVTSCDEWDLMSFAVRAIYLTPPAATYSGRAWERIIREH